MQSSFFSTGFDKRLVRAFFENRITPAAFYQTSARLGNTPLLSLALEEENSIEFTKKH